MSVVCFDTQIMIWGVKRQATSGQENNIEKAKYLIHLCERERKEIMVPSVVVAELLCTLEPTLHNSFREMMQKQFIVPPFDSQAAMYFAKMWREKKQSRKDIGISRAEMKADFLIIATAITKGATCIYSEDIGLRNFAQDYIEVHPLPNVVRQMSIEDLTSPD